MHLSNSLTTKARPISSNITTGIITLTLGLVILFAVGFAQSSNGLIHNAAHDTRHTLAFPCH